MRVVDGTEKRSAIWSGRPSGLSGPSEPLLPSAQRRQGWYQEPQDTETQPSGGLHPEGHTVIQGSERLCRPP